MKTVREKQLGKVLLRLLETKEGYAGVLIKEGQAQQPILGDDPMVVWSAMERSADRSGIAYFGFDGAAARFLRCFPEGFAGQDYLATERDYKVAAADLLAATLPIEKAQQASAEDGAAAARVFGKANLLSPFEQARIRDVLKGPTATAFLRGAAAFTTGDIGGGLLAMLTAIRPHGQPSWPMMTYLPFLWRPTEHMFLKPQVTVDFAERVGHRFARVYGAGFEAPVYDSLLDLVHEATVAVAGLKPLDGIDLQSFIWVVGAYKEPGVEPTHPGLG